MTQLKKYTDRADKLISEVIGDALLEEKETVAFLVRTIQECRNRLFNVKSLVDTDSLDFPDQDIPELEVAKIPKKRVVKPVATVKASVPVKVPPKVAQKPLATKNAVPPVSKKKTR